MSVSIILPIKNSESTLRRSIDSVLSQSFSDFELLCVLNNSSDLSENIVSEYAKKDSRFKILHSEPGIVPALNLGLRVSTHEIIARQDSDDMWYPSKLEKQVKFLEKNREIDILGIQIQAVDEKFKKIDRQEERPTTDIEIKKALLGGWNCIPHPGVVFRKRILSRLGGYDDTYPFAEDYSLWLRAIKWYKFSNLDEVLMDYTAKHNPSYDPNVPNFLSSIFRAMYGVNK